MVGPKGQLGPSGSQGQQGPQGFTGASGATGQLGLPGQSGSVLLLLLFFEREFVFCCVWQPKTGLLYRYNTRLISAKQNQTHKMKTQSRPRENRGRMHF